MRTIIEIGAHAGVETKHFLASPDVKVYAFEPNIRRFKDLFKLSQENPRLYPLPFAINWGDNQEPLFHDENDAQDSLNPSGGTFGKQFTMSWTMRLDTFIEMYGISSIDYLRIDAPFSEEACLDSLGDHYRIVKEGRVRVYDKHSQDVLQWLIDHDFTFHTDIIYVGVGVVDITFRR